MLRITSGSAKGKKLKIPNIPDFRGVQDKAKLAIFSILGDKVENAECLDIYAGSGNLGIEALSRGAKFCEFVDESKRSEVAITENLLNTGFSEKAEVFRQDAVKFVGNAYKSYDIIFMDPFFDETHFRFLFENLEALLDEKGVIIFSHGKDTMVEDALTNATNLRIYDEKRYGAAFITVLTKISPH